jgi:hypothetical protein
MRLVRKDWAFRDQWGHMGFYDLCEDRNSIWNLDPPKYSFSLPLLPNQNRCIGYKCAL